MPVDDPMADDAPDAGAMLRAARDAAGLSVQQVAQRLKLTVRVIEAIEANDRRGIPAMVYLRGYARSYARLLGMDPEPLLVAYAREATEPSQPVMAQPRPVGKDFPWLPVAIVGGGLLALLLLFVWQWPEDDGGAGSVGGALSSGGADVTLAENDLAAPTENVVALEVDSNGEVAAAPDSERIAAQGVVPAEPSSREQTSAGVILPAFDAQAVVAEGVALDGVDSGAAATGNEDSQALDSTGRVGRSPAPPDFATDMESVHQAAADLAERRVASPSTPAPYGGLVAVGPGYEASAGAGDLLRVRRITPLGDDELWFEFTDDCWVEVFNTEGHALYENLLRRRQSLRLIGTGPFQIRLGYAPGAMLEYNGEPVRLGPHTRNNVASLVLGQ